MNAQYPPFFSPEPKKIRRLYHAQAMPDEIFLGLFCDELFNASTWKTKRRGTEPEDTTDRGAPEFPIFISMREMTDAGYIII